MAVEDLHDPALTPLLLTCSEEELQPLVDYIQKTTTNTFGKATRERAYVHPQNRLVDDIVWEIRTFGGNSFVNAVRGDGVPYAEIVRDVSSKMKVKPSPNASLEESELALLLKILDDALKEMSPEQRADLEEEFRRAGVRNPSVRAGIPIATMLAQAGIQLTGFLAYRVAVIVANAVARAVLGRGLSFAANAAFTRALGIFAGPVGWAITGIWTAIDLAGPAYRVTIPCVCHVAFLRQKHKLEDLADS